MNLPRRGPKCILPPCTVRQIDGEAKISPRISFGDLFKMFDFDVTSSPNWELDSTFMSTNYFEVMSNLRSARCHWNATGMPLEIQIIWQQTLKVDFALKEGWLYRKEPNSNC